MKKHVHILVIGNTEKAVPAFLRQQEGHHLFTYCARDNYTNDLNNQPGRCYDWIVIDGESLGGDETELIQSLRATGFFYNRMETRRSIAVVWNCHRRVCCNCGAVCSFQEMNPV